MSNKKNKYKTLKFPELLPNSIKHIFPVLLSKSMKIMRKQSVKNCNYLKKSIEKSIKKYIKISCNKS